MVNTILVHCGKIPVDSTLSPHEAEQNELDTKMDPNIGFQLALKRVNGDQELYKRMTEMFVQAVATTVYDLNQHILHAEKNDATRLLHTLKGVAGTIGADSLVRLVSAMEEQLKQTDQLAVLSPLTKKLNLLIQTSCQELMVFSDLLHRAAENTAKPVTSTSTQSLDKQALQEQLNHLNALMTDKNMRTMTVFSQLKMTFGVALGDYLIPLENAINQLDFPLALEKIQQLQAHIKRL
jgi:two-component system sensor histidine kinase/response regulator